MKAEDIERIDEALDELLTIASEYIGPSDDEDASSPPACGCCGMELDSNFQGHRADCLVHHVLAVLPWMGQLIEKEKP